MKDTILMASLGYFTYSAYMLFFKRKAILKSVFLLVLNFYIIFAIKNYVILAFVPALTLWIFLTYRSQIKIKAIKVLATPVLMGLGIGLGLLFYQKISAGDTKYSADKVLKYAIIVQKYHTSVNNREEVNGSGYDLGEMEDLSPLGILKTVPKAINVTLFRPYIWEIKKPILLISVLESFLFLLFTIYIFFKTGLIKTFKVAFSDPNVVFCLIFSMIFAFAVGFSTYNFGALARYKIPCIPFYFLALFIMYDKSKHKV